MASRNNSLDCVISKLFAIIFFLFDFRFGNKQAKIFNDEEIRYPVLIILKKNIIIIIEQ